MSGWHKVKIFQRSRWNATSEESIFSFPWLSRTDLNSINVTITCPSQNNSIRGSRKLITIKRSLSFRVQKIRRSWEYEKGMGGEGLKEYLINYVFDEDEVGNNNGSHDATQYRRRSCQQTPLPVYHLYPPLPLLFSIWKDWFWLISTPSPRHALGFFISFFFQENYYNFLLIFLLSFTTYQAHHGPDSGETNGLFPYAHGPITHA